MTFTVLPKTYKEAQGSLLNCRKAFGRMLRNWRLANGWTQYTYCNWAKATGNESSAISYGNLSVIEQGTAGELRQKVFWQLWEQNRRIHAKDWGSLEDKELEQRLTQAKHIEASGGVGHYLWGPGEFWECYNGLLDVPAWLRVSVPPRITEKQARQISTELRGRLHKYDKIRSNGNVLELLGEFASTVPETDQLKFINVLMGFDSYNSHELSMLWDSEYECYLPQLWIPGFVASPTKGNQQNHSTK